MKYWSLAFGGNVFWLGVGVAVVVPPSIELVPIVEVSVVFVSSKAPLALVSGVPVSIDSNSEQAVRPNGAASVRMAVAVHRIIPRPVVRVWFMAVRSSG